MRTDVPVPEVRGGDAPAAWSETVFSLLATSSVFWIIGGGICSGADIIGTMRLGAAMMSEFDLEDQGGNEWER